MTDEQARIRSYLQAQGARQAPADIVDKVLAAMADLRRAAGAIPTARFEQRPEPEEWSGNEVLAHVVDAGRHFGDQIIEMLADTPRPRRGLSMSERRPMGEWFSILERDRQTLFDAVRAADPNAKLVASIQHQWFGMLNWREALLFMRLHDLDHVGQLQKIAAALA